MWPLWIAAGVALAMIAAPLVMDLVKEWKR